MAKKKLILGEKTRWKPGQSGNPEGRPKGRSILKYIEEYKDTEITKSSTGESITAAKALAQLVWQRALDSKRKDSIRYIDMILNRLYGKSKQQIEHKGELRTVADLIIRAHEYDNTESKRLVEGGTRELHS